MADVDTDNLKFKDLPWVGQLYISAWIILLIIFSIIIFRRNPFLDLNLVDFGIFLVLSVFFSLKPLTIIENAGAFDITNSIYFAIILLFEPVTAFFIILISNILAIKPHRPRIWAYCLNISTYPINLLIAALAFHYLRANQDIATNLLANIPALIAAVFIVTMTNFLEFSVWFRLVKKISILKSLRNMTQGMLIYEVNQYSVSVLLALVYQQQRFALILFVLPFILFYFAFYYQSRFKIKEKEAVIDPLTSLYNRRYMDQKLIEFCEPSHNKREFCLIMLDLDNFKILNDTFGHIVGDKVLKRVASITKICIREKDLAFRFGGEEFSIILPDTKKSLAVEVAKRLRLDIEKAFVQEKKFSVTVSIGIASYPVDAIGLEQLIRAADSALYIAKKKGKNRVTAA